jgi:hypothetical protein
MYVAFLLLLFCLNHESCLQLGQHSSETFRKDSKSESRSKVNFQVLFNSLTSPTLHFADRIKSNNCVLNLPKMLTAKVSDSTRCA